jgi:DEAD/DEAH box helicase domain-containing protein
VFCDGWAYHKDSIRIDALKRSAIVVSGLFWVWSVTHHDVKAALAGSQDCDMDSPLVALSRHDGTKAPATLPRAQEKAFTQNAVAGLVRWLAMNPGGADAALEILQRNATWLSFLMVPSTQEDKAVCDQQMGRWLPRLPPTSGNRALDLRRSCRGQTVQPFK